MSSFCIPNEFDGALIAEQIEEQLCFQSARGLLPELKLSFEEESVRNSQKRVKQMEKYLSREKGSGSIGSRFDPALEKSLLKKDRSFSQEALATIGQDFVFFDEFQEKLLKRNCLLIAFQGGGVPRLKELAVKFEKVFEGGLEVVDSASENLQKIRKKKEKESHRLRKLVERLSRSRDLESYLQEEIVAVRDGRYVLLVKSDFLGRMQGVRHGVSQTGQSTYFEPTELVEANNRYLDFFEQEQRELARILSELNQFLFQYQEVVIRMLSYLREMDLLRALTRYSQENGDTYPEYGQGQELYLSQFEHPLIENCKANTITMAPGQRMLLVSGPNSGGKTVTLKCLALSYYFCALGMRVKAHVARLPEIRRLYFILGDQQSLLDSLSSFSSQLKRWKSILGELQPRDFLIVDEIMNATDPREGEALAYQLLLYLKERGIRAAISTHYPGLKEIPLDHPEVLNACMLFESRNLEPTFELQTGSSGNSFALELAHKYKLPKKVLKGARELVGKEHLQINRLLEKQKRSVSRVQKLEQDQKRLRETLSRLVESGAAALEKFQRERDKYLARAHRRVLKDFDRFKRKTEKSIRLLQESLGDSSSLQAGKDSDLQEVLDSMKLVQSRASKKLMRLASRGDELAVGDRVQVLGYNKVAQILEIYSNRSEVLVSMDKVRLVVPFEDLSLMPEELGKSKQKIEVRVDWETQEEELDLRGLDSQEAEVRLEIFADRALARDISRVRIIHGKGKLKSTVKEFLQRSIAFKGYEQEEPNEGSLILSRLIAGDR